MPQWKAPDFLQSWDKGGPFVAGVFLGAIITLFILKFVSGERSKRLVLDAKREEELRDQLREKDKRIDALHDRIEKLLKDKHASLASPRNDKKGK